MNQEDFKPFAERLTGVYGLYGKNLSQILITIWIEAMRPYDYPAICEALNRHAVNPDNGQFPPKPADIVKLIGGNTLDAALLAWSKVTKAIIAVGSYQSVVFDDALIHAVINAMGGWPQLCSGNVDDLPFRARDFDNLYRSWSRRVYEADYPRVLLGRNDLENGARGFSLSAPILVGDPGKANEVYIGGTRDLRVTTRQVRVTTRPDDENNPQD